MNISPTYLLYGVIALCAILLVEGIFLFIVDHSPGRRMANRRMKMMSSGMGAQAIFEKLRRSEAKSWSQMGTLGQGLINLNKLITRAGLTISTSRIIVLMTLLSFFIFVAMLLVLMRWSAIEFNGLSIFLAAVIALGIGFTGPILIFARMKSKRMKKFTEQLPDAIDMMVRSLRAGHPVGSAIGLTAKEMHDPIGTEFGIMIDEMTYGLDLPEALLNVGERVDVPEFDYLVVAISIQHETGGNLAEVLNGLSVVIRGRFQMFRKIRALSAEGRFSAGVLSALPMIFAGLMMGSMPEYYLKHVDDVLFAMFMGGAFIMQLFGIIVMKKLINFRV